MTQHLRVVAAVPENWSLFFAPVKGTSQSLITPGLIVIFTCGICLSTHIQVIQIKISL